jgi:hypothetical protein
MPEKHDPQMAREPGDPVPQIPKAMRFVRSSQALPRIPAEGKPSGTETETTEPKPRVPGRQRRTE